jgi:hypothetical protein
MFATVSVTLSTTTLASLLERQQRLGGDLSSTIEDAVEHWLSHQARVSAGARRTASDPSSADCIDTDSFDTDYSHAASCDTDLSSANRFKADAVHANAVPASAVPACSVQANAVPADSMHANPGQANSRHTGAPADVTREYCGYQWKSLFLPEGTLLRSWSYGEHRIARVVGNRILHEGRSVSPNQFARSFARSVRNAWKDISVCLPGEKTFQRAFRLRDASGPAPLQRAAPALARNLTDKAGRKAAARAEKSAEKAAARQACLQTALEAAIAAHRAAQDPATRQVSPGARWDLPERRTLRYRLEDVAFE